MGLKRGDSELDAAISERFQTNPCGIEAGTFVSVVGVQPVFQTNPCGIEARAGPRRLVSPARFQTNPCGIEADRGGAAPVSTPVSDEPLWD